MVWEYNTLCPAGREEKERKGREAMGGEGRWNWNRQLPIISPGLICFQQTFSELIDVIHKWLPI